MPFFFFYYSKKLQHHVQLGSLLLIPTTNTKVGAAPGSIKEGEEFIPILTADVHFSSNLYFSLLLHKLKPSYYTGNLLNQTRASHRSTIMSELLSFIFHFCRAADKRYGKGSELCAQIPPTTLSNQNTDNTSHISKEDLVGQYKKHTIPVFPPKISSCRLWRKTQSKKPF